MTPQTRKRFEHRKKRLVKMIEIKAPNLIITTEAEMLGGIENFINHLQAKQARLSKGIEK
jgi:hypothetical protein